MSSMKLRKADRNDLEQLVDVKIAAFSHMPLWEYWYLDGENSPARLRDLVRADWLNHFDECDIGERDMMVIEEESKIIAFSVWDLSVASPEELEGQPSSSETADIKCDTKYDTKYDTKIENVPRMRAVDKAFGEAQGEIFWNKYEKQQHQLIEIGTHPDHRRRGAARMMLETGLEKAAKKNVAVTLFASPMGRAMYKHFGFSDCGERRVQIEGEKEYLDIFCMAWEPPKHE